MNNDTPRKKRIRERLVERFSEDWEIDFDRGPTIRRKSKRGFLEYLKDLFGRKHSVFAMYWFFKHDRLKNENSRKFDFPIKHDNMPVPGVPFKYEMKGSWLIEDEDLKYIYGGPLVDQHGDLLVPVDTNLNKIFRFAKLVAPVFAIASALIAISVNFSKLLELVP